MVLTPLYRSLIVRHFLLPTPLKVLTLPVVVQAPFSFRLKVQTSVVYKACAFAEPVEPKLDQNFFTDIVKYTYTFNYNAYSIMFVNSSLNIICIYLQIDKYVYTYINI